MKVSFQLSSKSTSTEKPKSPDNFNDQDEQQEQEEDSTIEFITEFNPETPTQQPILIIPPLPNTWKPYPTQTPSPNPNPNSTPTTISYGLNIRPKKEVVDDMDVDKKPTNNNVALELKLLEKFREDIKKFPDDEGLEEFVGVPVNGYGKAVLAGYGWYEGRGIGKNAKPDVKVVQYRGIEGKAGLGFVPRN